MGLENHFVDAFYGFLNGRTRAVSNENVLKKNRTKKEENGRRVESTDHSIYGSLIIFFIQAIGFSRNEFLKPSDLFI